VTQYRRAAVSPARYVTNCDWCAGSRAGHGRALYSDCRACTEQGSQGNPCSSPHATWRVPAAQHGAEVTKAHTLTNTHAVAKKRRPSCIIKGSSQVVEKVSKHKQNIDKVHAAAAAARGAVGSDGLDAFTTALLCRQRGLHTATAHHQPLPHPITEATLPVYSVQQSTPQLQAESPPPPHATPPGFNGASSAL
jgi:hypothetical protein